MPPAGTGALSRLRSPLPVLAMALAWIAIGAWLYARSAGLNPAIFADEWYYSKMARLQPLAEAIVPSYLYLWIFKASNACGDGFLDCVRFGNIVFFAGAAPFIYLSARQVAGRGMAFAVTVLALLAPVNLYTALFMPEACYYFGFAVLAWVALTRTAWGWAGQGAAAGLVLGLMSLIKVHAVFLLPGVCLFLACAGQLRGEAAWLRRGMQSAVLAALLALAVKFGLGWVLAGETGLSLFGSFYSNTATTTARTSKLALLAPAFINGRGHLMALAVLLPLPLAMILHALVSRAARARLDPPMKSLLLFSFLMLGSAAGLTVVYTASIRDQGLDEILRLHLRYYSFVFPLLLMVAAAAVGRPLPGPRSRSAWLAAALVAAAILVAQVKLPLYRLSTIDGPELASAVGGTGQALAALDLLVLLLWACGSRLAAPLFLFAAVPLAAGNGMNDNAFYLAQLKTSWAPEKAGRFAHAYVPVAEHNRIAVGRGDYPGGHAHTVPDRCARRRPDRAAEGGANRTLPHPGTDQLAAGGRQESAARRHDAGSRDRGLHAGQAQRKLPPGRLGAPARTLRQGHRERGRGPVVRRAVGPLVERETCRAALQPAAAEARPHRLQGARLQCQFHAAVHDARWRPGKILPRQRI
jgi:phosphoglycerol transferase